jgi:Tol biopolymer transport system component
MLRKALLLGLCLTVVSVIAAPGGAAVITERISITSYGGSPNGASWWPSFNSDGRYVAFYSGGGNIVPGDTNHVYDVFVRDRLFQTVELVSLSSLGEIGNGASYEPAISGDGRYVAFPTAATNLSPDDTNGVADIVVRDRDADLTLLVSVTPTGSVADGESLWCSVSGDGRYVAFQSSATNLIEGETILWPGVYVRDMVGGTTEYISRPSEGVLANEISVKPSITPDGRYVAYRSYASNLVAGDTNGYSDAFLFDRNTGVTERVSVATLTGAEGNGETRSRPAVTPDARYVVFSSVADNLVAGDTNGKYDVFIRDRNTGVTERVSVSSDEVEGDDDSGGDAATLLAVSDDGRYVAFASIASNLVPGDTNGMWDVFVRDRTAGTTQRVSVSTAGDQGNDHSGAVSLAMTPDGQTVGFDSLASNLVLIDTNRTPDVFVRGEPLAPRPPMLVINDDAEYTTSTDVTLSIDPGDYVELRFKNEGEDWTAWEPASVTRAWTLPGGDGLKRVYTQGRNGADESVEDYDEITLDTTGPQSPAIAINGDAATTISRMVTLTLSAGDAVEMRLRNESSAWTGWMPFSTEMSWKLSHDRGTKTVAVGYRDAAGNVSSASDTIQLICFTDVCTGYWAFEEIMACVDASIVQGYPEGDYKPLLAVTRDQMAVYVGRSLAGGDENVPPGPAEPSFWDVATEQWAYHYIEYAVDEGVVQGYPEGDYRPALEVDRAQMAVYIARSIATPTGEAGLIGYDPPDTPTFPDVLTDHWAYKYVEYAYEQGVVKGYSFPDPDNPGETISLYQPDWVVTRDQMAVYVQRAFVLPTD